MGKILIQKEKIVYQFRYDEYIYFPNKPTYLLKLQLKGHNNVEHRQESFARYNEETFYDFVTCVQVQLI